MKGEVIYDVHPLYGVHDFLFSQNYPYGEVLTDANACIHYVGVLRHVSFGEHVPAVIEHGGLVHHGKKFLDIPMQIRTVVVHDENGVCIFEPVVDPHGFHPES
jgi:hypothetical protein